MVTVVRTLLLDLFKGFKRPTELPSKLTAKNNADSKSRQKNFVRFTTILALLVSSGVGISPSRAVGPTITEYWTNVLSGPNTITVGPDGKLWFAGQEQNKIGNITTSGIATKIKSSNLGFSTGASAIAAGPDGNIWYGEAYNYVSKMDPASPNAFTPITALTSLAQGYFNDLTAGPDGNMWAVQGRYNSPFPRAVIRITPAGAVTSFTPTSLHPNSITAGPDGNMWFTFGAGNAIGKISMSGEITEYPLPNADSFPNKIIVGPDGNLWFTETSGNRIGKITTAGVITEYDIPTTGSGTRRLTAARDGKIYFAEYSGHKIGSITVDGTFNEISLAAGSSPYDIVSGPDGALWFTEYGPSKIATFAVSAGIHVTTATAGTGSGYVSKSVYTASGGSTILTATPGSNSLFTSWSCTGGPTTSSLTVASLTLANLTADATCTATFSSTPASATSYTLNGPTSGTVNSASANFTITPVGGIYTGTISIALSGGGLSTPITKTFTASSEAQTFTITPTAVGSVTLTPTSSAQLGTDPAALTYTVNAAPIPAPDISYAPATIDGLQGTAVTSLTPTNSGGAGTFTISPALPAGLSINATTGVISGTPTKPSASATYTVTATNTAGTSTATVTVVVAAKDVKKTEVSFANINFASGSSALTAATRALIEKAAKDIIKAKKTKIVLSGYTDSKGSAAANLRLSKDRAQTVQSYLDKKLGKYKATITVKFFGASKPIAGGNSAAALAANRRVEILAS